MRIKPTEQTYKPFGKLTACVSCNEGDYHALSVTKLNSQEAGFIVTSANSARGVGFIPSTQVLPACDIEGLRSLLTSQHQLFRESCKWADSQYSMQSTGDMEGVLQMIGLDFSESAIKSRAPQPGID